MGRRYTPASEATTSGCQRREEAPVGWVAWAEEAQGGEGDIIVKSTTARRISLSRCAPPGELVLLEQSKAIGSAVSDTVRHVFAGTFARTMAQAFVHPIDTVKTRLQVRSPPEAVAKWKKSIKKHSVQFYVSPHRVVKFKNFLYKGPRDVYLGLTGAILGTLPVGLLYFSAYEVCKSWMERAGHSDSPNVHLLSASAGAVVSSLVRVPTDTIRHRVQAYVHANVFEASMYIVKNEGIRGLYSGMMPTIIRDVPEIAIQFALYERLRKHVAKDREKQKLQTWEHLVLGGFSGACAAVVTMPFDVLKTTMQCGTRRLPLFKALVTTVEEKGVKGLFRGLYPRVTQVALMSAVFFTMFEFWKLQLKPTSLRDPEDQLLAPKIYKKKRDKVWKRQFVVE